MTTIIKNSSFITTDLSYGVHAAIELDQACVDGLNQYEVEEIADEWVQAGTHVLMHTVLETAEMVE